MSQTLRSSHQFTDSEATLAHVLARRVSDRGDKPWILAGSRAFTYSDVDELASRFAAALARLGVTRGDTVLLMLNNCIEFIALWCALSKIGAIEVPINCHYRGRLLAHVVNDSHARVMIVDEEHLPRLAAITKEITTLTTLVVFGTQQRELDAAASVGAMRVLDRKSVV